MKKALLLTIITSVTYGAPSAHGTTYLDTRNLFAAISTPAQDLNVVNPTDGGTTQDSSIRLGTILTDIPVLKDYYLNFSAPFPSACATIVDNLQPSGTAFFTIAYFTSDGGNFLGHDDVADNDIKTLPDGTCAAHFRAINARSAGNFAVLQVRHFSGGYLIPSFPLVMTSEGTWTGPLVPYCGLHCRYYNGTLYARLSDNSFITPSTTYFDFRKSTGTAISNYGDGTLCSTGKIICKYVVINLGKPAAAISGVKYYQLNMAGFNIMGNGCDSGALDIAVYNDAAYTNFDHAFALDGSGSSPSFFSASVDFSVPADKFAQLIFGCNDGGGTAVTLIDGSPGTYEARDINSIRYTGLPNLCIGDTPADCGATINTGGTVFDFENQSGSIATDTGNGPIGLNIRLGQPKINVGPGTLQVRFFQNGTGGCPDPGYSFQAFADNAYTIPVGTAFKLLTTADAAGNPITLEDYNGIVTATIFGAFDVNKYYTVGFGSCDASRPISIRGDGSGNYVCTQTGGRLGLFCLAAYYEGAFPYLIVSPSLPNEPPLPLGVTAITPNHGTRGQVIPTVVVSGTNFQPGTVISFNAPGIEVLSYISQTSTQVTVSLLVSSGASLGSYDLIVTNPDSQKAIAANAFLVTHRPVVVIPGIMGSVLEASDSGEVIWINATKTLTSLSFDVCDDFLLPLTLAADGSSPAPQFTFSCGFPRPPVSAGGTQVKATGLLVGSTVILIPEHFTDIYSGLLAALNGFPTVPFPYDWRLDYKTIAKQLRVKIEQLAPNPWDHVDIVAHSQGGLIAQAYLALNQGDTRVGQIIYLGTPHRGATKAFAALKAWQDYEKIYDDSLFPSDLLNFNTMVFIGRTFPALYELLPQYDFFQTDQTDEPFIQTYSSSFAPSQQFLVSNAESLWNLLQNEPPSPIVVAINGSGFNTLFKLQKQSGSDCLIPINDPSGDGTVPLTSATARPNTLNFFANVSHGKIPNDPTVAASVVKILDGIDPLQLLELGLSASPFKATNSIRGYTCSPVEMTVTDAAGNIDGFDSLGHLLRQIPNSEFFRFDSTEGVLLPSQPYNAILVAINAGTFSVVFDFLDAVSNTTRSVQFRDVPISFGSRAQLALTNNNSPSTLRLDIAGTGTTDFTITEGQVSPPSSFLAALRDILANLGLRHNISKRLEDILDAVAELEREHDFREARKRLLHFDDEISDLGDSQVSTAQAHLIRDMVAKAITLLPSDGEKMKIDSTTNQR